ncbi:YchJ family protein [Hydrogenimonas cancrithermarum]|uniref:UPF0225 protein n=1 Tax=Hydrogenimonas cancrithermarum TaxID=2993563 RepID=A0ABM8FP01_9BACT|nr:YchJ family metal-binding protein [Hydrogenimonas cancrithermarum]BDY13611.1 UPF0225 protein [Hydrogenimonas cancrithermarum]
MQIECPCGSGLGYEECCGKFVEGKAHAPTAEALMRSRYAAYALKRADYIVQTALHADNRDSIASWMEKAEFFRLEIVQTKRGGVLDKKGIVEFRAWFKEEDEEYILHEISAFVKRKGRWYYDEEGSETVTL